MSEKGDFLSPILETPRRIKDALSDSVRRRHVLARLLECGAAAVSAGVVVFTAGWYGLFLAPIVGTFVDFLVFEYITEPLGWAGYYWERGPRDEEKFVKP